MAKFVIDFKNLLKNQNFLSEIISPKPDPGKLGLVENNHKEKLRTAEAKVGKI